MRPHFLPTLALCSLACSVALAGLWAWSWWRYVYVAYAHPGGPRTAIARCDSSVLNLGWWGSTLADVSGLDVRVRVMDYSADRLPARMRDAAIGFSASEATVGPDPVP